LPKEKEGAIRTALAGGLSVRKTAAKFNVNPSTVQNISRPFVGVAIAEGA
jgi:transposase-like protein